MMLFEDRRRQMKLEVLRRVEAMLPASSAQERQQFVDELDRAAYEASGGLEEEYVRRVNKKLKSVERKLEKQAEAHSHVQQPQPGLRPLKAAQPGMSMQGQPDYHPASNSAQGMTRSGSSHSGGSKGLNMQHEQLMRQQQQQAMLGSQQTHASAVGQQSRFMQQANSSPMHSPWQSQAGPQSRPQSIQQQGFQHQAYQQQQQQPSGMSQTSHLHRPAQQYGFMTHPQHQHQQAQISRPPGHTTQQQHMGTQMGSSSQHMQGQAQGYRGSEPGRGQQNPFPSFNPQQQRFSSSGFPGDHSGASNPTSAPYYQGSQGQQVQNPFENPGFGPSMYAHQAPKKDSQPDRTQQHLPQLMTNRDSVELDEFHASPSMKQMITDFLLDPQQKPEPEPPQRRFQQPMGQTPASPVTQHWQGSAPYPTMPQQQQSHRMPGSQYPASHAPLPQQRFQAQPQQRMPQPMGNPRYDRQPGRGQELGYQNDTPLPMHRPPQQQGQQPFMSNHHQQQQQRPSQQQHQPMTKQHAHIAQQPANPANHHNHHGSFMGMLTEGEGQSNPGRQNQQSQPQQAASSSNPPGQHAGSHSGITSHQPVLQRPAKGSPEDYTDRYWELLKKAQRDMIPVFDKFKVTLERLTPEQREEKSIKKMAGIYGILPRLKIQPTDVQYRSRVWAKPEYDQLQMILQQLYPYCMKLNQLQQAHAHHASSQPSKPANPAVPQQNGHASSQAPALARQDPSASNPSSSYQGASQVAAHPGQQEAKGPAPHQGVPLQPGMVGMENLPQFAMPQSHSTDVAPAQSPRQSLHAVPQEDVRQEPVLPKEPASLQQRLASTVQALQAQAYTAGEGSQFGAGRVLLGPPEKPPEPPKHLLPAAAFPYYHPKLSSKRKHQDLEGMGFEDKFSPTSVLDPFPEVDLKREAAVDVALSKRRKLLERECFQAQVDVGQGMLLSLAGGDPSSNKLVVHIAPNQQEYKDALDSVLLPPWLSQHWKVLTVEVAQWSKTTGLLPPEWGPESLQHAPLSFHYSSMEGLHFKKAQAAQENMEQALDSAPPTFQLASIAQAWMHSVHKACTTFDSNK